MAHRIIILHCCHHHNMGHVCLKSERNLSIYFCNYCIVYKVHVDIVLFVETSAKDSNIMLCMQNVFCHELKYISRQSCKDTEFGKKEADNHYYYFSRLFLYIFRRCTQTNEYFADCTDTSERFRRLGNEPSTATSVHWRN